MTAAAFLDRIETFLTDHGMAPSTFGRDAMGDGDLVRQLRAGRVLSMDNGKKLSDFMAAAEAAIVHCDGCDRPGYDPVVRACTRTNCPAKGEQSVAGEARAA